MNEIILLKAEIAELRKENSMAITYIREKYSLADYTAFKMLYETPEDDIF